VKKREVTEAARQNRKIAIAGPAPQSAAQDMGTCSNRVVLAPRHQGVADGGGDEEEEMADVDEEKEEAPGNARDGEAKNISVRAEWLHQCGGATSEPSETPRWWNTPRADSIPRVALHIALRSLFHQFFSLWRSPIVNEHSGGEGQL